MTDRAPMGTVTEEQALAALKTVRCRLRHGDRVTAKQTAAALKIINAYVHQTEREVRAQAKRLGLKADSLDVVLDDPMSDQPRQRLRELVPIAVEGLRQEARTVAGPARLRRRAQRLLQEYEKGR